MIVVAILMVVKNGCYYSLSLMVSNSAVVVTDSNGIFESHSTSDTSCQRIWEYGCVPARDTMQDGQEMNRLRD